MNRKLVLIALAAIGAWIVASPALAITGGSPDTVHTNVGLVRFTTAEGRFRCSGTLISQTVVLTAGHCTAGATNVYVSFDDALQLDPLQPGISDEVRAERESHYITGVAHADPGWTGLLSFSKQHDQGVVILDAPASSKWPSITPAPLPPVGYLDSFNQGALKNETFTLVGYGVDIGPGTTRIVMTERRFTTSYLKNIQSEVIAFQINDNDSKAGGGSCFGDSGGAVFLNGYVLGDASYVNSLKCNATGTYQRADTEYSQAFLNTWLTG